MKLGLVDVTFLELVICIFKNAILGVSAIPNQIINMGFSFFSYKLATNILAKRLKIL